MFPLEIKSLKENYKLEYKIDNFPRLNVIVIDWLGFGVKSVSLSSGSNWFSQFYFKLEISDIRFQV